MEPKTELRGRAETGGGGHRARFRERTGKRLAYSQLLDLRSHTCCKLGGEECGHRGPLTQWGRVSGRVAGGPGLRGEALLTPDAGVGSRGLGDAGLSAPTPCPSTESPSVSVTGHAAPGHKRTLKCLAYDFYPRSIGLHWTRAGDAQEAESGGDVLPSGNGTYQSWVVVGVPSEDQAPYSCHVEHRSLTQPLTVPWDPRQQAQ